MSGVSTATVLAGIGAAAGVASAVGGIVNGQKQDSAAKKAAAQSKSAADKLYAQQDQANNKANARGPDVNALFAQNQVDAQQGPSGNMLTGPQGIDPNSLSLGKNTVLGA